MLPVCEEQRDALRHVKLFVPVRLVSFWGHVLSFREHHSDALRDVELFVPVWLVSFWEHVQSDDDERPLRYADFFSLVFHRHSSERALLVVSSESEVLPERLGALREFVHSYAHCCSYLHVFLPARAHPQRLPLLHPHHDDYNYCSDDYYDGEHHYDHGWRCCFYDYDCGWCDDYDCGCFSAGGDYYCYDGVGCLCFGAVLCCG